MANLSDVLEPDYTSAEDLRARGRRAAASLQAQDASDTEDSADRRRLILSSVLGALGRTAAPAFQTANAIRGRRLSEAIAQRRADQQELDDRRFYDRIAATTGEPGIAASPHLADVLQQRRERIAAEKATAQAQHDQEFGIIHPPKQPRPLIMGPETTAVDPDTMKPLYTAPPRQPKPVQPKQPKGTGNRDLQIRRMLSHNSERSSRLRAEDQRLDSLDAGGTDPRTLEPLTPGQKAGIKVRRGQIRDELTSVDQDNQALQGMLGPETDATAPTGTAPKPKAQAGAGAPDLTGKGTWSVEGYSQDEIEQLRQAMNEDDRDEFDTYSPEGKKRVLDKAYGRNGP